MIKDELCDALESVDVETMGKWYCDLNCWKVPDGFPFDPGPAEYENKQYMMAFDAVGEILGEVSSSRAWWIYLASFET